MKFLILILIGTMLTSPSWGALSCSAYIKDQKAVMPVARFTFSIASNKKHSATVSKDETVLDAAFTTKFLTNLTSYFSGKSTTTSRLEERAVMSEAESAKLLSESGLNWEARDAKRDGEDLTTITTYSGKFVMDSGNKDVEISAKLRARKYYAHNIGESDTEKITSIFGDIGSLEIKVSNVVGVSSDGFKVFPASVFKPRVFIADETLKKLSEMSFDNLRKPEVKKALVEELHALTVENKQLNSNKEQISEFIDALTALMNQNPDLFEVQTVVAYNRDSYRAKLDNGTEYQYTLDRGVRIYEPDSKLDASNRVKYLDNKPLHQVEEGVAFAELKSPMIEKTENTPNYQKLSHALFSKHISTFKEKKGKHSLGARVRNLISQTTLSEQLYTEGLFYYMIKGIGNLPYHPDSKRVARLGIWDVALPVMINGEKHKLVLNYQPVLDDGSGPRELQSIALLDSHRRKVELDSKTIKHVVNIAVETDNPTTITIDNQALTFPGVIPDEVSKKITAFFNEFYKDFDKGKADPRDITSLNSIQNSAQLNQYIKKVKFTNTINFLKDRIAKYAATAVLIGVITFGPDIISFYRENMSRPNIDVQTNVRKDVEVVNYRVVGVSKNSVQVLPIEVKARPSKDVKTLTTTDIEGIEVSPEAEPSSAVIRFK